jgi:hypothetical protein
MIDVQCSECGRVLIGTRQILSLVRGRDGLEISYVCGCGRVGAERVGRARRGGAGAARVRNVAAAAGR